MECMCKYEKEMGALLETVKSHDRAINGNGQPGLRDTVTTLNTTIKELVPVVESLRVAVSGFGTFQKETEVTIRNEEKVKADKQVKKTNVQWIITTGIVLLLYILDRML